MNGVRISKLDLVKERPAGDTHGFSLPPKENFMVIRAKAGHTLGEHYHEGKSPGKSPEIIVLEDGSFELYCKHVKTGEEFREILTAPCKIEIDPFVWHEVHTKTDVVFIEFCSIEEHNSDTIKELSS